MGILVTLSGSFGLGISLEVQATGRLACAEARSASFSIDAPPTIS
jgi:hypothetical protein